MRIYVASSWRNETQPSVINALRLAGHAVYDFRHPVIGNDGFSWTEIEKRAGPRPWTARTFATTVLEHETAREGFALDMRALETCDALVFVQPCGVSAALELGYAVGRRISTIALFADGAEPELMLSMVRFRATSIPEVVKYAGVLAEYMRQSHYAFDWFDEGRMLADRLGEVWPEEPVRVRAK